MMSKLKLPSENKVVVGFALLQKGLYRCVHSEVFDHVLLCIGLTG